MRKNKGLATQRGQGLGLEFPTLRDMDGRRLVMRWYLCEKEVSSTDCEEDEAICYCRSECCGGTMRNRIRPASHGKEQHS